MSPAPEFVRGARELRRLLREQTFDLRGLDLAGFRAWLDRHLARWQEDPVFVQRTRIRDLRRAHPELRTLESAHRRAAAADSTSAQSARLRRLEQELADTGRAISGLTAALKGAAASKRLPMRQKLGAFQARRHALLEEHAALLPAADERRELLRAEGALEQFRAALGLAEAEACLDQLLKEKGRHSGRTGELFEELARGLVESVVVPDRLRRGAEPGRPVRVLQGVTLGAARTEFDFLVVREPRTAATPVEVLAVVEVKRNLNDLAHGFLRRQENLAWLTGDSARYHPADYRTRYFRSGHFDREALHQQGGETFPFTRASFRRFRRDAASGFLLGRLYFVTRSGPLWGVPASSLARIGFRVSTDERWDPKSDEYLGRLLRWCQLLAGAIETPDVLRMYAEAPACTRQLLVVER